MFFFIKTLKSEAHLTVRFFSMSGWLAANGPWPTAQQWTDDVADYRPTWSRLWADFGPTLGDIGPTLSRLRADFRLTLDQLWANFGPTLG